MVVHRAEQTPTSLTQFLSRPQFLLHLASLPHLGVQGQLHPDWRCLCIKLSWRLTVMLQHGVRVRVPHTLPPDGVPSSRTRGNSSWGLWELTPELAATGCPHPPGIHQTLLAFSGLLRVPSVIYRLGRPPSPRLVSLPFHALSAHGVMRKGEVPPTPGMALFCCGFLRLFLRGWLVPWTCSVAPITLCFPQSSLHAFLGGMQGGPVTPGKCRLLGLQLLSHPGTSGLGQAGAGWS